MHDAAFGAAGIDARYVLLELEPDEVAPAVDGGARSRLARARRHGAVQAGRGRAVSTRSSPTRSAIGAVNNVAQDAPTAVSSGSTPTRPASGPGSSWRWAVRSTAPDVVVAGAGGAAHAVVYALPAGGCAPGHGRRTGRPRGGRDAGAVLDVGDRRRAARGARRCRAFGPRSMDADLAVNATTVGMVEPGVTIPVERLPAHATVFDLVYVPAETPLLRAARATRPAGGQRVRDADRPGGHRVRALDRRGRHGGA